MYAVLPYQVKYCLWDSLCARYNVTPLHLHNHCNGCGTAFVVMHTLICNRGSLVITHHKKICEILLCLSHWAFTPESVRAKPLIHQGWTRSDKEIRQGSEKDKEMPVDVIILGLWGWQVKSHHWHQPWQRWCRFLQVITRGRAPGLVGNYKKDDHGKHCYDQWKHFHSFFFSWWNSRERSPGHTPAIELNHYKEKDWPFFHVRVWINFQMKISLVISYSRMICGSRLPSPLRDRESYWDPKSGNWLVG